MRQHASVRTNEAARTRPKRLSGKIYCKGTGAQDILEKPLGGNILIATSSLVGTVVYNGRPPDATDNRAWATYDPLLPIMSLQCK